MRWIEKYKNPDVDKIKPDAWTKYKSIMKKNSEICKKHNKLCFTSETRFSHTFYN